MSAATGAPGLHAGRPYPGLRPYESADSQWFFGRNRQIRSLYRLLGEASFIAVVGSSGSGKSSLVKAGLLPAIAAEVRPGEKSGDKPDEPGLPRWMIVNVRPGDRPVDALAAAIAEAAPFRADPDELPIPDVARIHREKVASTLRRSSLGVVEALRDVCKVEGPTVLLVVDQFEEVFRLSRSGTDPHSRAASGNEAAAYVGLLLQAAADRNFPVRVMLTMRSDYIGECARFPGLTEAVAGSQFLVPQMTRAAREEALRKPAEQAGGAVADNLVQTLLNDSTAELDQLPVLQHAMMRMWDVAWRSEGRRAKGPPCLGLDDYRGVGGIAKALANHADEVAASPEVKASGTALEQCFRALAEFDREGRAVRRALSLRQLREEAGVPETDLRAVVERFRQNDCSFLVPPTAVPLMDDTIVDIGHEALIRNWVRLSGGPAAGPVTAERTDWLAAEARDAQTYRLLLYTAAAGQGTTLSLRQARDLSAWWKRRPPTPAWAARYGGDVPAARGVLDRSEREHKRSLAISGVFIVGVVMLVGYMGYELWSKVRDFRREHDNAVATSYWSQLAFNEEALSRDEVDTAWELAGATDSIKAAFTAQLVERESLLRPASSPHMDVVLRAMGIGTTRPAWFVDLVPGVVLRAMGVGALPSLRDALVDARISAAQSRLGRIPNPENAELPSRVIAASAPDLRGQQTDQVIAWLETFLRPPSATGVSERVPDALSALAARASEARGLDVLRKVLAFPDVAARPGMNASLEQILGSYIRFGQPPELVSAESWAGNLFVGPACFRFTGTLPDNRLGWLSLAAVHQMAKNASNICFGMVSSLFKRLRASPEFGAVELALQAELKQLLQLALGAGRSDDNLPRLGMIMSMAHTLRLPLLDEANRNELTRRASQAGAVELYLLSIEPTSAASCNETTRARAIGIIAALQNSGVSRVNFDFDPEIVAGAAKCLKADDATTLLTPIFEKLADNETYMIIYFTILREVASKLTRDQASETLARLSTFKQLRSWQSSVVSRAAVEAAMTLLDAAGRPRSDMIEMTVSNERSMALGDGRSFLRSASVRQFMLLNLPDPPAEVVVRVLMEGGDTPFAGTPGLDFSFLKSRFPQALEPEQASKILDLWLDKVLLSSFVLDPDEFADSAAILSVKLPEQDARSRLKRLADTQDTVSDRRIRTTLARTEAALVRQLGPGGFPRALDIVRWGLANSSTGNEARDWAASFLKVLANDSAEGEPPDRFTRHVAEVLAYPTAAGAATDVLLDGLHDKVGAPGSGAGLDANMTWIAKTFRSIDLQAPPKRPARPDFSATPP